MTLKLEAGKKYRTRGGDEVEILRTGLNADMVTVVGVHTLANGSQKGRTWLGDGYFYGEHDPSHLDLISEIKPKRVVWLNVYEGDDGCYFYDSREEANKQAIADEEEGAVRIACIRVEFEEGEGLDE